MGNKKQSLLNDNSGQSVVEYILMIALIGSIVVTSLNSKPIKDLFGEDSNFFKIVRERMEFAIRHGLRGRNNTVDYSGNTHPTYRMEDADQSRFFTPLEDYPPN